MLTRDSFDKMDEAALRTQVILPLLMKLGYQDVFEYHGGASELGKDVVCWKMDELGGRENLAIVAKATQMTGKAKAATGTAAEVQTQIRQCFGSAYRDQRTGEERQVDRVWVVNSQKIGKESINAISSALGKSELRNVRFIDGDTLWGLVEKYLPISVMHYIEELRKQTEVADTHYKPRIRIEGGQTFIGLEEKFPGAADEKPFTFKAYFVSAEAATEFNSKKQHYKETGELTEIPADLIERVEFPDFFRNIFGTIQSKTKFSFIPSPSPKEIPARIKFLSDDGDQYVQQHIVLRGIHGDTKRATLVSEEGDVPFQITIVLHADEDGLNFSRGNLHIEARHSPCNAVQYLEWLLLATCLSKPVRVEVENVETGITLFDMRLNSNMEAPDPNHVEFIKALATIQKKTKVPLLVPERDLTLDEVRLIEELHKIVTVGRLEGTWDDLSVIPQLDPELLQGLIQECSHGRPNLWVLEHEEVMTLFDTEVPLGRVRKTLSGLKMENMEELRQKFDDLCSGEASIELHFKPTGDAKVISEYFEWIDPAMRPASLPRPESL